MREKWELIVKERKMDCKLTRESNLYTPAILWTDSRLRALEKVAEAAREVKRAVDGLEGVPIPYPNAKVLSISNVGLKKALRALEEGIRESAGGNDEGNPTARR
jgi:hypothetical protein